MFNIFNRLFILNYTSTWLNALLLYLGGGFMIVNAQQIVIAVDTTLTAEHMHETRFAISEILKSQSVEASASYIAFDQVVTQVVPLQANSDLFKEKIDTLIADLSARHASERQNNESQPAVGIERAFAELEKLDSSDFLHDTPNRNRAHSINPFVLLFTEAFRLDGDNEYENKQIQWLSKVLLPDAQDMGVRLLLITPEGSNENKLVQTVLQFDQNGHVQMSNPKFIDRLHGFLEYGSEVVNTQVAQLEATHEQISTFQTEHLSEPEETVVSDRSQRGTNTSSNTSTNPSYTSESELREENAVSVVDETVPNAVPVASNGVYDAIQSNDDAIIVVSETVEAEDDSVSQTNVRDLPSLIRTLAGSHVQTLLLVVSGLFLTVVVLLIFVRKFRGNANQGKDETPPPKYPVDDSLAYLPLDATRPQGFGQASRSNNQSRTSSPLAPRYVEKFTLESVADDDNGEADTVVRPRSR